jgi:hypothetical protein
MMLGSNHIMKRKGGYRTWKFLKELTRKLTFISDAVAA